MWKYVALGMALSLIPGSTWIFFSHRGKAQVLSVTVTVPTPTLVPSPTPTETPTPTPTRKPTPKNTPTPKPTPTPTPVPVSSEQINGFIEQYARQYSVDPNQLRHIAICESGFNPNAVNGPYAGLYQFASKTWSNNRNIMGEDPNPGLRLNAEESVQTAAYLYSIKGPSLWPNCKP